MFAFSDGCKLAQRRSGGTAVNEFGILGSRAEELVVAESTVTKESVDLISSEVAQGVRTIWCIAGSNGRRVGSTHRKEGFKGIR